MSRFQQILFCIIGALSASEGAGSAMSPVVYFKETAIPLSIDSSRVVIRLAPVHDSIITPDGIDAIARLLVPDTSARALEGFVAYFIQSGGSYESFLDSLRENPLIAQAEPFYRFQGEPCLFGSEIFLGYYLGTSQSIKDSLQNAFGLTAAPQLRCAPHVNRVRIPDGSPAGVLDIAQALAERPETFLAHPDIALEITPDHYKTYDYYQNYSTHVKKTGGVASASSVWDFAGLTRPVVIAIVDDGVGPHEDLPASRLIPGWDIYHNDSVALPGPKRSHGMACAGLAAASHTTDSVSGLSRSSGVLSVAPNARIMSIKIYPDDGELTTNLPVLIDAYHCAWKMGADVISVSTTIKGSRLPLQALSDAVDSAFFRGRNGLGSVIVGSSGNKALEYPDFVNYPSAYEHVLAVGAMDDQEDPWYYSQYGDALDVLAPSGLYPQESVWSLDQMWSNGSNDTTAEMSCVLPPLSGNDQNYHCEFGGTSAAAPQVAGIAALLLSRDSTLTSAEVYDIIRYSADTGLYGRPQFVPPLAGFGYGRADAFRALSSITRGDMDNSGSSISDVLDLTVLVEYLFNTFVPPFPTLITGDCDCDGATDIADVGYMVNYLFLLTGPPPVNPCFKFSY